MEVALRITRQTYYVGLFIFALLVVSMITVMAARPTATHAAACGGEPASTTGRVSQQISVPTSGTYTIWSRIKAPDSNPVEYKAYIDGQCFTIGQTTQTPGALTWIDYENGSTVDKATVSLSSGTQTLVLTAGSEDLELDRVMLLSDDCVPTGTGDNCLNDTTQPTTSITSPVNGSTINGAQVITANATDNDEIDYVEFYRDGSTLLGSDNNSPYSYNWDTTGVANGSHTLTVRAYDLSGNIRTSTAVNVTVNNTQPVNAAIASFNVTPQTIYEERSSQLSWSITVGAGCTIDHGIGNVSPSGTRAITPSATTTYTLSCNGLNGGSSDSEQVTVTVNQAPDTDGDNVKDYVEQAAPNGGDANGDSIPDWQQSNVASFINSKTEAYNTLVASGDCDVVSEINSETGKASYLLGSVSFALGCTVPGQTGEVELILDKKYKTSKWTPVKVNTSLTRETDISEHVTLSTVRINNEPRTSIKYNLEDGGALDEDESANASIIDPFAIRVATLTNTSSVGAPDTGTAGIRFETRSIALTVIVGTLGLLAVWCVARGINWAVNVVGRK